MNLIKCIGKLKVKRSTRINVNTMAVKSKNLHFKIAFNTLQIYYKNIQKMSNCIIMHLLTSKTHRLQIYQNVVRYLQLSLIFIIVISGST